MNQPLSLDLLAEIAKMAVSHGATDAEVVGLVASEFSVEVRLGEIEKVREANTQGIGLRVLHAGRQASCSTSETSRDALETLVTTAVEMARLTSVDEAALLPSGEDLATDHTAIDWLATVDPQIEALPTPTKIEMARLAEQAARESDPRIVNSEGASCSTINSQTLLVTTAGFAGSYEGTTISLVTAPIARDGDQMQVGYWGDRRRRLSDLDTPVAMGHDAARRALRQLGARKGSSLSVPSGFVASARE
ncbi:MAG: TldD/PmbA family protein, partial [Acidobacteriota bacterium]